MVMDSKVHAILEEEYIIENMKYEESGYLLTIKIVTHLKFLDTWRIGTISFEISLGNLHSDASCLYLGCPSSHRLTF